MIKKHITALRKLCEEITIVPLLPIVCTPKLMKYDPIKQNLCSEGYKCKQSNYQSVYSMENFDN